MHLHICVCDFSPDQFVHCYWVVPSIEKVEMVPLSNNEGLSDDNPSRWPLEAGYGSSSCVPPKFKPRRVSCVRDFPVGCGPNAPRNNMKPAIDVELRGDNEILVADQMMANIVVADCDRTSEVGAEFQSCEGPVQLEMSGLVDDLAGKVMATVGMANGDDKLPANVEPFACGSPKNLERITPKLSRESDELEVDSLLKGVDDPENKPVLENWSLVNGVSREHTKACSPAEWPISGTDVAEDTVLKNMYPQKRVSATRDFPPFCGRNAPCPNKEERCRIFLSSNTLGAKKDGMEGQLRDTSGTVVEDGSLRELMGVSVEKSERDIQNGNTQKNELKGVMPEPRDKSKLVTKKSNSTVGGSDEKMGQEFTVNSHDVSLKRRRGPINLGCEVDRVIVLGLMAAPNCPWRQGRGARKIKSDAAITGSKTKKHDFTSPDKPKHTTLTDNSEEDHFAEKPVNDNSVSTGKEAHENTGALIVRDEDDSSVHDEEQYRDSPAGERPCDFDVSLPPFGPNNSSHGDSRNKVRETLRLFQAICRKLLQGEEAKLRQGESARSKQRGNLRIDLLAAKIIRDKGKEVNTAKQILGAVPGVEVGDEFQYRVELALIGVHRLYQAGIDYIKHGGVVIASSIVASGGYADDLDSADVLIYSGQGGIGHDKKPEDQKLERGNLALKNSISARNPVRVIRGFKETKASNSDARAKLVATYTYDGLYTVERYWQEPGPLGKLVFKFELRRIPGQQDLAWKEVKKSKKYKMREGLCVDDVSGGKELFPICAVNTVDDEKPAQFTYTTRIIYPDWYHPIPLMGCDCTDGCSDSKKCSCVVLNGGEIPYNHNGAIVEVKPLVYECGPSCKCPPSCYNRVSQHGIKIQLEIFKTQSRGWGVRSLTSIPSGSFICEYVGELLEDKEAERRTGNDEYLFDIGQNYNDCSISDVPHGVHLDALASSSEVLEDGGYTIDAAQFGNLGRFINHSCSPNLYAQNVLYDHDDKRMPHIMLFAAENIPPLQELTYHYNYSIDQIRDSNGNIKMKSCYCGSTECTGRMY